MSVPYLNFEFSAQNALIQLRCLAPKICKKMRKYFVAAFGFFCDKHAPRIQNTKYGTTIAKMHSKKRNVHKERTCSQTLHLFFSLLNLVRPYFMRESLSNNIRSLKKNVV